MLKLGALPPKPPLNCLWLAISNWSAKRIDESQVNESIVDESIVNKQRQAVTRPFLSCEGAAMLD